MTEAQTYSWIFYAVALASQREPVNSAGIESVADGINHAVPTQKEMQTSLAWSVSQNLIQKEGKAISIDRRWEETAGRCIGRDYDENLEKLGEQVFSARSR